MENVKNKIRILAIESSCDETAAAVIHVTCNMKHVTNFNILSNVISSQVKLHAKYGGVYPELASREHIKNILPVIKNAIQEAGNNSESSIQKLVSSMNSKSKILNTRYQILDTIDAIAVTTGPGLIGSLLVGVNTAKTLAYALKKPIYAINHLEGHIYSNFIRVETKNEKLKTKNINNLTMQQFNNLPSFPLVSLVVSGGHTSLVYMKNHFDYHVIGETLDDAAGEAFDKVAKLLGLGYPGGPAIAKIAMEAPKTKSSLDRLETPVGQIPNKSQFSKKQIQNNLTIQQFNNVTISFPRPMIDSDNFDFSFSGLKTSVLYTWQKLKTENPSTSLRTGEKLKTKSEILNLKSKICYEFQNAVVETLVTKTLRAAVKYKVKSILLCGGVSANQRLREEFAYRISHIANRKNDSSISFGTGKPLAISYKPRFFVPEKSLSTDNAAMIGIAAAYRIAIGKKPTPWYDVNADANAKLH